MELSLHSIELTSAFDNMEKAIKNMTLAYELLEHQLKKIPGVPERFFKHIELVVNDINLGKSLMKDYSSAELFLNAAYMIYSIFTKIDRNIEELLYIIKNEVVEHRVLQSMSGTDNKNLQTYQDIIKGFISAYKSFDRGGFSEYIYNKIDNVDQIALFLDVVPETNDLIIHMMKKYIKTTPKRNEKIISKLEKLKDSTLGVQPARKSADLPIIDQLLSRFGLAPITVFTTLEKALKNAHIQLSNNQIKDFNGLENPAEYIASIVNTKAKKIVYIRRHAQLFIEFNIFSLINQSYIKENKLETSSTSGLNNVLLRRYDIIKLHNDTTHHGNEFIDIFGDSSAKSALIIESLNDKLFRVLRAIPDTNFSQPTRPHAYGKLAESIILKNAIEPQRRPLINGFYESKLYSNNIYGEVLNKAIDNIKKRINERYAELPKSIVEIRESITNVNYASEILSKTLVDYFSDIKSVESKITILTYLETIITRFTKEFNAIAPSFKLQSSILENSNNIDKRAYIIGVSNDIINAVFKSIKESPSIFDDLEYTLKEHVIEEKSLKV